MRQFNIALENWINTPTVDSTYDRNLTEKDLPDITVCLTNQTNYTRLYELGYQWKAYMHAGISNCSQGKCLSWGHHLNLTYQKLFQQVHNISIADSVAFYEKYLTKEFSNTEIVFLPRYGHCKEMSRYELTNQCSIVINSRKQILNDVRIFLTDRTYRSHFSLDFSSHLGNNLVIPYGQAFSTDVKIKVQSS